MNSASQYLFPWVHYYSTSEHSADVGNYCGYTNLYSHPPTTDWIGFIIGSRARCPPTSEAQLTNCMLRLHVLSCACMHACMSRDRCEHVDARIIDVRRLERFFFVCKRRIHTIFACLAFRRLACLIPPTRHAIDTE